MKRIEMPIEVRGHYQWDAAKSSRCLAERKFDFAFAIQIWRGPVKERIDQRRDYGEVRYLVLGQIGDQHYVVVYTWRGNNRHIISARRAHLDEVLKWDGLL